MNNTAVDQTSSASPVPPPTPIVEQQPQPQPQLQIPHPANNKAEVVPEPPSPPTSARLHGPFGQMILDYRSTLTYAPITNSNLHHHETNQKDLRICVAVRKRPLNKHHCLVHVPKSKVDLTTYLDNQTFKFDYTFDEKVSNELVYHYIAAPLIDTMFNGGNATVFAYGKTSTMGGDLSSAKTDYSHGIYAQIARGIFHRLLQPQYRTSLEIFITFYEIYCGKVFDLLNNKKRLRVFEDQNGFVQVCDQQEQQVKSIQDVLNIIQHVRGKNQRRVLVTMDMYNGQPVLVKSSQVCEIHSDGNYWQAIKSIGIFPDILIVDLNGAFGETDTKNREIIKKLALKYPVHTGGGLRSLSDVEDVLKSNVRRCTVASADDELIAKIPKDRLIVEMSINENNEVLIHGRKTNTHVNIITKVNQLIAMGVNVISITFVNAEGHLSGIPRKQIQDLLVQIPKNIEKIYIAGGISTMDDLEYLWSFNRIIPQLGSAIWKKKLTIGSIFNGMINFDGNGTVSSIIQDLNGLVKGLCYMNRESIEQTCETRQLYRYSRRFGKVMMKGETSGDIQHIVRISLDCDMDAMLMIVDSQKSFCHAGNYSCFSLPTSIKANLATLAEHIKSRINQDSYSGRIQRNPQLALAKIMEEFWEVVVAHQDNQISECSDLLVHLVMYLNGSGISIEDIFNELHARRWAPKLLVENTKISSNEKSNEIVIGISASKYPDKTDEFAEEQLGIKIARHSGRNLLVEGQIVDRDKFCKYFSHDENMKVSLFISRPQDMPWLLASKRVAHVITFETVIKNYPKFYTVLHEIVDPSLSLALVCRKGACVEPEKWTAQNKPLIASEHVHHVTRFLEQMNIKHDKYHLDKITGSSEGFLVNTDKYLLADTIVETGKTLEENNLEIWKLIIPKGQLRIGLYGYCN
ncbi:unnamed protein product [Rotaria socialis]|uniref:Kinesin motor domain-containing protein n=2 Tax=Rotaria socialis TaxID=392032 RepID=A0A818CWH3_9BILA|nr:unnamed protein product [Rotaria socialis]